MHRKLNNFYTQTLWRRLGLSSGKHAGLSTLSTGVGVSRKVSHFCIHPQGGVYTKFLHWVVGISFRVFLGVFKGFTQLPQALLLLILLFKNYFVVNISAEVYFQNLHNGGLEEELLG